MMTQREPGLSSDIEFLLPPADVKYTPAGSKRGVHRPRLAMNLITRPGKLLSKSGAIDKCCQHIHSMHLLEIWHSPNSLDNFLAIGAELRFYRQIYR